MLQMQKMSQIAPKVIKVVNLRRFKPETPETSEIKRTKHNFAFNAESSSTIETIANTYHGNEQTEIEHMYQNTVEKKSDVQNDSESHLMQLSSRSKIKFRNCSHTPEELSTLHEHTDETLVKVGDIFENRDALKEYLNDNAKIWHYYYVCRNSKKKIIEYNCICMAYNNKEREVVIRRQKRRTTACPCKIRLTIDQTTHKVLVYYVCNHHDHPTTANAFHHYPHAKYLPQLVKEEFLDLTYLGLDVELIQKYIHSVVGLTIKKKDIWSYTYRFKRKIFKRSISCERRKYMEDLMIKIRATYGESCDSTNIDRPSEQSELVESIDEDETEQTTPASHAFVDNDNIIGSTSEDISIIYSEDSLHKEPLDSTDKTEVIVQYINEDGILCDENGVPVTNSSAIIQFINNYTYVTPDKELEQTVFIELVDERIRDYPTDLESLHNQSTVDSVNFESELYDEGSEGPDSNDTVAEDYLEHEQDGAVINENHEESLSPTRPSDVVYADMNNFRKYYYVDHRYIALDQDSAEQNARHKAVCHGKQSSNSSVDQNREEYIKAPDFVCYPTAIRHCSGHDHLTLLTDADAVWPGAKFLTHEVFLAFINERASRWRFYYSLVESGKSPENYVYKCVYGKTRVSKNAYRAKGLRKRNKLTTQCPCQIRLRRLEAEPAYLTVLYSCNHHDHSLDERQFGAQPHSRRLPGHIKEEVKDLITLRVSFDVIRKYVAAVTGVRVYGKYFHNVRASMRARGEHRRYTEQQLNILTAKIREYCELSDKDDFAQEVCIAQADNLPAEDTAKQSRLETRLQNLSHKDIQMKVKKLQESLRAESLRGNVHVLNAYWECVNLKRVAPKVVPDAARMLAKIINRLARGDGHSYRSFYSATGFRMWKDLMSHYSDLKTDKKRMDHFSSLCVVLFEFLKDISLPNTVELMGIYGRMVINSFTILDTDMNSIGTGVYLASSIVDHSCRPNAVATFDGKTINLRALTDLPCLDWEQIRISYIDLMYTPYERQTDLLENYYFLCQCEKCLDETQLRTVHAAKCLNAQCNNTVNIPWKDCPLVRRADCEQNGSVKNDVTDVIRCDECGTKYTDKHVEDFVQAMEITEEHLKLMKNASVAYVDICQHCLSKQGGLHPLNVLRAQTLDHAFDALVLVALWERAREIAEQLLPCFRFYYGERHPLLGILHLKYGKILLYTMDIAKALEQFKSAEKILKITHGFKHPLYREQLMPIMRQAMVESESC